MKLLKSLSRDSLGILSQTVCSSEWQSRFLNQMLEKAFWNQCQFDFKPKRISVFRKIFEKTQAHVMNRADGYKLLQCASQTFKGLVPAKKENYIKNVTLVWKIYFFNANDQLHCHADVWIRFRHPNFMRIGNSFTRRLFGMNLYEVW